LISPFIQTSLETNLAIAALASHRQGYLWTRETIFSSSPGERLLKQGERTRANNGSSYPAGNGASIAIRSLRLYQFVGEAATRSKDVKNKQSNSGRSQGRHCRARPAMSTANAPLIDLSRGAVVFQWTRGVVPEVRQAKTEIKLSDSLIGSSDVEKSPPVSKKMPSIWAARSGWQH
jgi:hypothetical protein